MAMQEEEIRAHILEALPDAVVEITDLAGDGDHYACRVVSKAFEGLNRVRQHQLVYEALGGKMGSTLHALALKTETP
ncbi:BolA family transcriptional regulator [Candidatus Kirkpatrickella diaphorinae]|uniref:BolA family transcriptional regulator n=1 Tax=Candidatus Kirkpatrickella diaphorinae TaxID=2984322 RepID=A0ABY6GM77_9PROT|nr:BolA family transcriptional regulator [Candidatus Kirkpatrickella diaphorinae]UYH52221.1 BolA family transcriptional regulator [Candidatus Kirkpatrickella diaphorinae]